MARKYNLASEIRGALRLLFRRSPQRAAALKRARKEIPKLNANGELSKKPAVWYECEQCKKLFKPDDMEAHHDPELGPHPGSKNAPPDLTWDIFINRLFCDVDGLKPLCKPCHRNITYKRGA